MLKGKEQDGGLHTDLVLKGQRGDRVTITLLPFKVKKGTIPSSWYLHLEEDSNVRGIEKTILKDADGQICAGDEALNRG